MKKCEMRERGRDADMVKVEILLSSLAAAACPASVGFAVWKLVLSRPTDPENSTATVRSTPAFQTIIYAPTEDESARSASADRDTKQEANESAPSYQEDVAEQESPEMTPESTHGPMVSRVELSNEWKVGGSRESLLRSMANVEDQTSWDSSSDITEWSSVADNDEYHPVRKTRSWKSIRQRPTRWIHVGYGRYIKSV
ncbi:unnamed protein product [Phytophthora lilii]|uniref:Unnamed protein product n=1 Tax=Phytophthora lilii TaxID=2077276 RepID=A0A9W6TWD7_9STRA|nr:unnamed protein product [Phytophthora lilii]